MSENTVPAAPVVPPPAATEPAPVLPPFEKTIYFEARGEDGKMYSGHFTFKRLNLFETAQAGAEVARLNGGVAIIDETADRIHTMLAHFKYGITKYPDWWKPFEMYDFALMTGVFKELIAHEASFRRFKKEPPTIPPLS